MKRVQLTDEELAGRIRSYWRAHGYLGIVCWVEQNIITKRRKDGQIDVYYRPEIRSNIGAGGWPPKAAAAAAA